MGATSPQPTILINGTPAAEISPADRGFQYGDGLFETFAVRDGEPALWDLHMQRLGLGCKRLGLPRPEESLLLEEARRLCAGTGQGVLKLILTRGAGGRGYRPPADPLPTRVFSLSPWPDYPAQWWRDGVRVRMADTRLACQPLLAGLKHLNRLEQVLARREWSDPDIAEALMCDTEGRLVEATQSNLFLLLEGRLVTPRLDQSGVAGVMRRLVLQLAADCGLPVAEQVIFPDALQRAEALMLSNALIGLWPVRQCDGITYDVSHIPRVLTDAVAAHAYRH